MRLLVIEDNRSLVANLFEYFEARGHTLDAAPEGITGLHLAGKPYPGHTELLTELTGGSGAVMMLAHGPFQGGSSRL